MKKYEGIIIGFGKGGKTLAVEMAKKGFSVAIIEQSEEMYGGTCINIGCIPTKFLVNKSIKNQKSDLYEENNKKYKKYIEEKNNFIKILRNKNYEMLDIYENIDIYNGIGSFVNNKIIEIKTEAETIQIEGEKIFINTGAKNVIPPIKGIENNDYIYDSKSIMELTKLPKNLVIIGGGYIGLEFAQIYRKFGSNVTVLESSLLFMPREEREIADRIKEILENEGISIELGAKVEELKNQKVIYIKDGEVKEIEAEAILVAVGRKPNIDKLKLENMGIELGERKEVKVDERLHTSIPNIWAIGDVHGGLQFTYTSLDDYRIIKNELFENGKYTLNERKVVPYTVFLTPQFSRVGLTEKEAIEQGYKIKIAKMNTVTPKMKIMDSTNGILKVIIDENTNKILGASFLMEDSAEIINIISITMKCNKEYSFLRDNIFTHPTVSEILNDLFGLIK